MPSEENGKLTGKVALVTGGSRGLGKAIAAAYAREGARVFVCARNQQDLQRAMTEIRHQGGNIEGMAADVGKAEDVKNVIVAVRKRYGAIDILVNNASILGTRDPIETYPLSEWEKVIQVNLTGLFFLTQQVLRLMIPRREGSIINISSGVGRAGKARWGAYAVSKFGVEGFTQVLAEEVKASGIRVNAVNPGATRTEMRAAAYPAEDPLTLPVPDEVTGIFLYLASDDSLSVTGKSLEARDWVNTVRRQA